MAAFDQRTDVGDGAREAAEDSQRQEERHAARSVRIERVQARNEAADIELQLRRERPRERIADVHIDVDEFLQRSKLRLALAEADARVPEQLIERPELPLQLRFVKLCRRQVNPRSRLSQGAGGAR